MPRACSVCQHPKRAAIEAAFAGGASYSNVAQRFAISRDSVWRHRRHLAPTIAKSIQAQAEVQAVATAETLLTQVKSLQTRALALLDQAEIGKDVREGCAAIRECRSVLELLGRVTRELGPQAEVNVAVTQVLTESEAAAQLGKLSTADVREYRRLCAVMEGALPPTCEPKAIAAAVPLALAPKAQG